MSEEYFPLQNIRKSPSGSWNLEHKSTEHTVPDSPPYVIRLKELPDDGSLIQAPSISGYSETTGSPGINTFVVRYNSGHLEFNYQNANDTFLIDYYAKGSGINADDINYLKSLIDTNYHHTSTSNKLINGTGDIPIGADTLLYHGANSSQVNVQIQYKSTSYNDNWINGRGILSYEIVDNNNIRIYNEAPSLIEQDKWRVLISVFRINELIGNPINAGSFVDINHNLDTEDILFQIQYKPTLGTHQDNWIDADGIMNVTLLNNNTIRVYNNSGSNIDSDRYRILIDLF